MLWKSLAIVLAPILVLGHGHELIAQTNSLAYLDEYAEAYYPGLEFPKLTTPQWIGEEGVDAVVTLAIDDMRDTARYEAYLRPILEHLKSIDGRAPVSIMTCSIDPNDPQLQSWLAEGLSIEVHTVDHPCPCLQGSNFDRAKSTYDRCVDMMASIEGNHPVAFRTPCCDSRNTPSPRLWSEIFNHRTPSGNFLQADSSVFQVFTAADPELPRELVSEPDGGSRFKKYIPFPSFVNTIENYPYPYVIGKLCWQFPCMVPSDWEAQNLHQPNNPKTVDDLKAALDATVIKKGMFNLVFHPHGWIRNDQVIEWIDYAQQKYGGRVKFLTFKECVDRINDNLLAGHPLRSPDDGGDNGVRTVDLNGDGFLDVMIGNERKRITRLWQPESNTWADAQSNIQFTTETADGRVELGVRFGRLSQDGSVSLLVNNGIDASIHQWTPDGWKRTPLPKGIEGIRTSHDGIDRGVRLRDLDRDGVSEILVGNPEMRAVLKRSGDGTWSRVGPFPFAIVDSLGRDNGVRLVDFDKDGHDDLIVSNGRDSGVRLYDSDTGRFSREVKGEPDIPLIVRDGTNNGAWFAKDHMWVQNEDTNRLPDGVDRRSFTQLLGDSEPGPRSPDLSLESIRMRPGFTVELIAAEPLVMDPIAIDWGPDGKLWVVEMADYPLGMDDRGEPGGRVRYLEDTDGDGTYDRSTLFLDRIAYPTGVIAWRDGVLVSAAPTIFFAADRDGDGKAEFLEDLYRGFGQGNQQHRVNGFERGLDNWIYVANGDSGGTIESLKTGKSININGRDLRIRPTDGALDAQAGQTQFGRHRDDHGNWFGCSNPLPVRHYVLADHYMRRNPLVKPPPLGRDIARVDNTQLFPISRVLSHWSGYKPPPPGSGHRFTSACSTMVYRDELFGDRFQSNTFTCEPVHNAVHRRQLVPSGVSFDSVRPADETDIEFLASTDSWFRPTTVTTGPDGALWIVDMYRLVIEHPEWIDDQREKELFLRAGHDRGRIYRVFPTAIEPRPIEELGELTSAELVERIGSPNGRVRDLAQALIIERRDQSIVPQLEATAMTANNPLARLHAICTLDGLGAIRAEILRAAITDPHPTVRRHAIRVCEPLIAHSNEEADGLLRAMEACDTEDPQVRLQLACSLGQSSSRRATSLLARVAAASSDDPTMRAAVLSSLSQRNLFAFHDAIQESQNAALFDTAFLEMAVRMKDTRMLMRMLDATLDAIRINQLESPKLDALARIMNAVRQRRIQFDDDLGQKLNAVSAAASQIAFNRSGNATSEQRIGAIRLLTAVDHDDRRVLDLVSVSEPIDVQIAAAEALVTIAPETLLRRFENLSPRVRSAILDAMLARERSSMQLVSAVRDKTIPLQALGAGHRQRLINHGSNKVKAAAGELFGQHASSRDIQSLMREYRAASAIAGDATIGQAVFAKHCSGCHRVRGIGHDVGPDLAALKNRSPEALLTAILDPNAAVEDKYRAYNILTLDGIAMAGVIANESSTAIELRMQDGKTATVLRDDIERIKGTGKSMMPEQMEKSITVAEMGHLLAFLNELGPPPSEFEGNEPATIIAGRDGTMELAATNCRIYGDQIRFEPHYRNIGYWSEPDARVEWTIEIGAPGKYEVWLDYACPDDTAGNHFTFACGNQVITGKVLSTETWDDYRQVKIGSIELNGAIMIATFRPRDTLNRFLLDLRTITLKPVQ